MANEINRKLQAALLTVNQTAERMNIKPPTVRKWLAQGRLPHMRLGRAVRVSDQAIEEFMAENTRIGSSIVAVRPESGVTRGKRSRRGSSAGETK